MTSGKRGTTSLYLERKLVETAKELGLNISKVCEIALKQRIEALSFLEGRVKVRGEGFEPSEASATGS